MPEEDSTVTILVRKLRSFCPPSLSHLLSKLSGAEEYVEFVKIVQDILPERELDILSESSVSAQLFKFFTYFEERYFPLAGSYYDWNDWVMEMSYYDLLRGIPLTTQSYDYNRYHDLPAMDDAAEQLMAYLVKAPFEENAARIPLGERCLEYVSKDLLNKVPELGFATEDLELWLKDTQYEGLISWAKIVTHSTDNDFIDIDEEDLYSGWELPPWTLDFVEGLTQEWQQMKVFWNTANALLKEVDKDPAGKFEEILNFILERKKFPPKEKGKTLAEIFAEESQVKENMDGKEKPDEKEGTSGPSANDTIPVGTS